MSDSEIEEERQAMLKLAGATADENGRYSMTSLSNDKFSTALDYMETSTLGKPNKKRRSKSKIYAIEKLALGDSLLDKLSSDIFKTPHWKDLSHEQLSKLQMTAKRIHAQRKK